VNVLVTGGAGFIGSNLVKGLLERGDSVTVLDDLSSGYLENLEQLSEIKFIKGDIRDDKAIGEATRNVDTIFHLAASVGNKRSIDFPLIDADINVMGTIKLLESARKAGVRKIVASSSAGIFGELTSIPINEGHQTRPDTPYGCTKLCMETECLAYAKLYEIEAVCLRYFNVYGPNQRFDAYGNVIPIFIFNSLKGERLIVYGDGEQTRDFVNVRDVVQANIKAALSRNISGAYNIGSGTRISINTLLKKISNLSNIKISTKYDNPRPGDVLHSLADVSSANTAFDYNPAVSIDEGLAEYYQWAVKEHNNIRPQ